MSCADCPAGSRTTACRHRNDEVLLMLTGLPLHEEEFPVCHAMLS